MPKSPQPAAAPPPAERPAGRFVEYDQFIDEQLDKTSGHVRSVDITGALLTLLAGLIGFFFLAALADHWLIPGGLGFWGRLIAWTALLGGSGYYFVREILPLLLHRINPVYAAQTIEHGTPGLKNGLVNFLLLKKHRTSITEPVFQAIEAQAAMGLAHTPIETAIDRSRLIKIGYALAALLLLGGAYKILSPKDPFRTIGRVMLPWANISPSTRVTILGVEPGSINVFRGEQVAIKVDVRGMPKDGEAQLIYSTGDAQAVDQRIRLVASPEGLSYSCNLPEASAGVQQDLRYRIEAGDAHSDDYTISMVTAPTIVVQSQDLVFPEYTGLTPQHIDHQGDVKGIEGARVTIHALANQPIKSGGIDFDCNNREDKPLAIRRDSTAKGLEATGDFRLALSEDRKSQEYTSYQLLFRNEAGKQNPQPATHRIEVVPDLPPEIEFLSPKSVDLDVPAGAAVRMEISGKDPDFALRRVRLIVALDGREIHESVLLDEPHRGQFSKKQLFRTVHTALKPGDVVEYWAVAEDNKTPEANRVETPRRRLRIVSPPQHAPGEQVAKNDDPIQFENPKRDNKNKNPQDDDQRNADKPLGADTKNDADRSPEKNSRDKSSADDGSRSADTKRTNEEPSRDMRDEPQPSEKPSAGDDKNEDRQPGEKNGEQQPQDGKNGQKGADEQSGGGGQGQKGSQDSQQQGGGSSGSGSSDGEKNSGGQSGGKSSGDKNSGDRNSGDGNSGENNGDGADGESSSDGGANGKAGGSKGASGKNSSSQKTDGGAGDANDQQPVAKDGVDDGSAIERIVKHQESHKENSSGDKPGGGDSKRDKQNQGDSAGANKPNGAKDNGASDSGANEKNANEKNASDKGGEPPQGEPGKGPKPADAQQRGNNPKAGDPKNGDPKNGKPEGAQPGSRAEKRPGEAQQDKPNDPSAGEPKDSSDAQKEDAASPQQQGQGEKGQGDQAQKDHGQQKKEQGQEGASGQGEQGPGEQGQGEDGQGKQENPNGKDGKSAGGADGKGSDKSQNKGQSDGGKTPGGKEGSPEAQGDNAPPSQSQRGGKTNEQKGQGDEAQSPSNSHKQDKSKGQTTDANSGDRSGNGGKGGGQPGKKPGKGNPGQGTESDEGDGRADSAGAGEDSARPGTDKKSDHPTGKPGQERGPGSTSRSGQGDSDKRQTPNSPPDSGDQGNSSDGQKDADRNSSKPDKPGKADRQSPDKNGKSDKPSEGQKPDSPQAGEPGDDAQKPKSGQDPRQPPGDRQPKPGDGAEGDKSPSADEKGDQAGDKPGGSGRPGGGQPGPNGPTNNDDDRPASPPPSDAGEAPLGDDPNLDYARKATDLALERLKDQMARGETDQALLDKLGWSQRDLEKFMDRWERMRSEANQNGKRGAAARQQLDDTLRSLGLRPRNASVKSASGRDDHSRGMKESRRTAPPAEYADQVKAYTEGASRGGDGK